jgi:hypothetical protein
MPKGSRLQPVGGLVLAVGARVPKIQGLTCRLVSDRPSWDGAVTAEFTIAPPRQFTFWMDQYKPDEDFGIHLVPPYHPVMKGMSSVALINGDTDYCIGGQAIKTVHCPESAKSIKGDRSMFGSTWTHVNHPFRAISNSFTLQVFPEKLRTAEGAQELFDFVCGALGLNNQYVSISGGFRAPLEYPHNRLLRLNRRSPYPQADYSGRGHTARGSESHCVWAYRTLKAEGVLHQTYIPPWFLSEQWFEIYEGSEECPGIF